jgi:hypothetical protein
MFSCYKEHISLFLLTTTTILKGAQQPDHLSKMHRIFFSGGIVFEPTVFLNKSNFNNQICSNFSGGGKVGIEFFTTKFYTKKRFAFSQKHKIFYTKLRDTMIYKDKKEEFEIYIIGYQFNFGTSIILNKDFKSIIFDCNNKINKNIHTLDILFGLKFEGGGKMLQKGAKTYPTKILTEILYKIDLKNGFSFFISITINRCFSPVYLFSFNKEDLKKVFNQNNFAWNIDINIGFIGLNFPV